MNIGNIGTYVSFGLASGAIYSVGAVGIALLLRTTGIPFLAFGDMLTAGAFIAYIFNVQLGMNIYLSMVLASAGSATLGIIFYWLLFKGFREVATVITMMLTIALAFVIRYTLTLVWGPSPVSFEYPTRAAFYIGPFFFNWTQIIIILISLAVMILFYIIMSFTRIGKGIRAVGDELNLAQIRGMKTKKIMTWTWFICMGLAGLSGVMLGMTGAVNPSMGFSILLLIFSSMILGGRANPYGAVVGGFIVGVGSELTAALGLPEYKIAVAILIMAIVLLTKPEGLFPAK